LPTGDWKDWQNQQTPAGSGWAVAPKALRCRICGKELANTMMMQEHLALCGKMSEVQDKVRGCDETLQSLLDELTRASEANMRLMLMTGT
jgi:hypothetical protein